MILPHPPQQWRTGSLWVGGGRGSPGRKQALFSICILKFLQTAQCPTWSCSIISTQQRLRDCKHECPATLFNIVTPSMRQASENRARAFEVHLRASQLPKGSCKLSALSRDTHNCHRNLSVPKFPSCPISFGQS